MSFRKWKVDVSNDIGVRAVPVTQFETSSGCHDWIYMEYFNETVFSSSLTQHTKATDEESVHSRHPSNRLLDDYACRVELKKRHAKNVMHTGIPNEEL
jgi:hypothetical protein